MFYNLLLKFVYQLYIMMVKTNRKSNSDQCYNEVYRQEIMISHNNHCQLMPTFAIVTSQADLCHFEGH